MPPPPLPKKKLVTHMIQSGIVLIENLQSQPLHYVQPLLGEVFRFYILIHKVFE